LGLFILCLFCALAAAAQLDSYTLRAKFGGPQGFDLTVDYGAGNQVCRLEVHALPPRENLLDLVPASMRGKELGRFAGMTGTQPAHSVGNETIRVSFKNDDCR